ncbi:MAG: hypothetical protein WD889_01295 [Candidatus Colwellbacteria bacterium]
MSYAQRRALKARIRELDKKYLGGFLSRLYRKPKAGAEEKTELASADGVSALKEIERQIALPIPSDQLLKRVELIILKYKDPEVETECAKRLIENTEWPYKLVFWDNRAGVKNMGKIWNKLIRESTCDFVALIDSDAFVPKLEPCWLTRCMRTFEKFPECSAVSPKLTRIGMAQQKADYSEDKPPEKAVDEFANTCCVFKKEVFEKTGYYDENFLIYGADSEWAARFIWKNEVGYLLPDVLVEHVHHHSAKKAGARQEYNREAEAEYAKNLYYQKIKTYEQKHD